MIASICQPILIYMVILLFSFTPILQVPKKGLGFQVSNVNAAMRRQPGLVEGFWGGGGSICSGSRDRGSGGGPGVGVDAERRVCVCVGGGDSRKGGDRELHIQRSVTYSLLCTCSFSVPHFFHSFFLLPFVDRPNGLTICLITVPANQLKYNRKQTNFR
jgi:hypothetical protein